MPRAAPKRCCLLRTPPACYWPNHQTQPRAAGSGCGHPEGADCGRGNRTETLDDGGRVENRTRRKLMSEGHIGDVKESVQLKRSTAYLQRKEPRRAQGGQHQVAPVWTLYWSPMSFQKSQRTGTLCRAASSSA